MNTAPDIARARRPRAGFTLLEMLIALGLVALVVTNIVLAMQGSTKAYETSSSRVEIEDQARRTLDKIALAVMGSSREGLAPGQQFPLDTHVLTYQLILGYEDGEAVWSDPERIEREEQAAQITWSKNPGVAGEQRVVWTKWVRDTMAGEIGGNLIDDNDNGLTDERGLSFTIEEDLVTIRLTLERPGLDGNPVTVALETQVNVRN
jgi:prepilin-type N-terminal cleavage/methylation domain-containing protein